MGLFSSITKVAKTVTGATKSFRKVLDLKPSLTGLLLPPQISAGLKIADKLGDVVGLNVPSEDEIRDYTEGKIEGALAGIKRSGLVGDLAANLDKANQFATKVEELNGKLVTISASKGQEGKTVDEILNGIDWLL